MLGQDDKRLEKMLFVSILKKLRQWDSFRDGHLEFLFFLLGHNSIRVNSYIVSLIREACSNNGSASSWYRSSSRGSIVSPPESAKIRAYARPVPHGFSISVRSMASRTK